MFQLVTTHNSGGVHQLRFPEPYSTSHSCRAGSGARFEHELSNRLAGQNELTSLRFSAGPVSTSAPGTASSSVATTGCSPSTTPSVSAIFSKFCSSKANIDPPTRLWHAGPSPTLGAWIVPSSYLSAPYRYVVSAPWSCIRQLG